MQLDGIPRNTLFGEEVGYLGPLITLKLDNLTHLFVVDDGTVAGKFLRNARVTCQPPVNRYDPTQGVGGEDCRSAWREMRNC